MLMIPPTYDPTTTSSGERVFFETLKGCQLDGYCFHSLRLARHPDLPVSEADFVILTAEGLLVVEVKSGRVECDDEGIWRYTGRNGTHRDTRGPIAQAEQAQWALRERLRSMVGDSIIDPVTTGWAAAFPQCSFNMHSVEWEQWQICDQRHISPEAVERWIRQCQRQWRARLGKGVCDRESLKEIKAALRPVFHVVPTLSSAARATSDECARLTEDQAAKLEILDEEPRVVILGGAGTGKTFLALESARQACAEGFETALVVPSGPLRAHLARQPELGDVRLIGAETRAPGERKVDVLVVDEAQDLLDVDGLALLDDWVENGFESGRWRIFLDDNSQAALVGRFSPDVLDVLRQVAVSARLRVNCRNTTAIVEHVQMLTGADIGVPTVASGPGVDSVYVTDATRSAELLAQHLKRLLHDGVSDDAIVILSPDPDRSCADHLPAALHRRLTRVGGTAVDADPRGGIRLATPLEFKGLESDFVCLVDLHQFDSSPRIRDELYVAMTRARASLWMAFDENLQSAVGEEIRRNLTRSMESER